MSFREKSAWVMALVLLAAGAYYGFIWFQMSSAIGFAAPPILPIVAVYCALVCVLAIAGHIVVALLAPREASESYDERDRLIVARSGHLSGFVFAWGAISSLGYYLLVRDGDALFHGVFISLMVSQIVEYALQIFYYRRTI